MSAARKSADRVSDDDLIQRGWRIEKREVSSGTRKTRRYIKYYFPPGVTGQLGNKLRELRHFRSGVVKPGDPQVYFRHKAAALEWLNDAPNDRRVTAPKQKSSASSSSASLMPPNRTLNLRERYEAAISLSRNMEFVFRIRTSDYTVEKVNTASHTVSKITPDGWLHRFTVKMSDNKKAGHGLFLNASSTFSIKADCHIVKLGDFGERVTFSMVHDYPYALEQQLPNMKPAKQQQESQRLETIKKSILSNFEKQANRFLLARWRQTVQYWNQLVYKNPAITNETFLQNADGATSHPYVVASDIYWEEDGRTITQDFFDPFGTVWGFINDPRGTDRSPNVGTKQAKDLDTGDTIVVFYALKDILPGDELLWDYGSKYDWNNAMQKPVAADESETEDEEEEDNAGKDENAAHSFYLEAQKQMRVSTPEDDVNMLMDLDDSELYDMYMEDDPDSPIPFDDTDGAFVFDENNMVDQFTSSLRF